MKTLVLILLSLLLFQSCGVFENEQHYILGCPDSFDVVRTMPQLIGGLAELQQKVVYPDEALKNKVEGRVIITFIVNKDGDPIQIKLVQGIGYGTFEASKEAVLDSKFKPGMTENGEPVCVDYSLPILFRLQN